MLRSPMRSPMSAGVRGLARGGLTRITISGTAAQGQTLAASIAVADASGMGPVSYQWKANGVAIAGATGSSYTLTQAEVGRVITVTASYTDGGGVVESVTSSATSAVALDPLQLFAGGEVGMWMVPGAQNMFQDAAGTTPVTAAGQPVGLVLDQSRGAALGPELRGSLSSAYYDAATDTYTISRSGASVQSVTIAVPAGRYLVTVQVLSGQPVAVRADNTATQFLIYSGSTVTGRVGHTAGEIRINHTADGVTTFRVHTLRVIDGWHAYQSADAARPIARVDAVTGAWYFDPDGIDDFLVTRARAWGSDEVTVVAAVERVNTAAVVIAELSASADANNGAWRLGVLGTGARTMQSRGATLATASSGNASVPERSVRTGWAKIAANSVASQINGGAETVASAAQGGGTYGTHQLYLFRRGGSSLPLAGRCYGLFVINRLLSPAELQAVQRDLAARAGIAL